MVPDQEAAGDTKKRRTKKGDKKQKKTKKGHPLFPVEKFMGVLFFPPILPFGRLSCLGILTPGRKSCALRTIVVIGMRLSPYSLSVVQVWICWGRSEKSGVAGRISLLEQELATSARMVKSGASVARALAEIAEPAIRAIVSAMFFMLFESFK